VMNWVEGGASIVGGCCEVGPSYIAKLREDLEAAGYRISPL
jgi:S-methylmethionine-dependent homocysteine/selenocysteine methylase